MDDDKEKGIFERVEDLAKYVAEDRMRILRLESEVRKLAHGCTFDKFLREIRKFWLRNVLGIRPATSILIIAYGGQNGMTPAFPLIVVAGGAPLFVQLIPLASGSVFDSPADLELSADDTNVVITAADGDTTGTIFAITTPASDTATSFNLDATGLAGGVQIAGTINIPITPATVVAPPAATSIGFVGVANPAGGATQSGSATPATTAAAVAARRAATTQSSAVAQNVSGGKAPARR